MKMHQACTWSSTFLHTLSTASAKSYKVKDSEDMNLDAACMVNGPRCSMHEINQELMEEGRGDAVPTRAYHHARASVVL